MGCAMKTLFSVGILVTYKNNLIHLIRLIRLIVCFVDGFSFLFGLIVAFVVKERNHKKI